MSYVSITGITIAIAVALVLVVGLLSYMSNLVKSAYQIKVDIRADMEAQMRKLEEDLGKKSKWMRAELGEDVARIKATMEQENEKRLQAIETRLRDAITQSDMAGRGDRTELRQAIDATRRKLSSLEQDVATLKEEAARRAAAVRTRAAERRQADESKAETERAATELREQTRAMMQPDDHGDDTAAASAPDADPARAKHPAQQLAADGGLPRRAGVQRMELPEFSE